MLAIAMDTFRLMHLVEKRGHDYVLIDGDAPAVGGAAIAEEHDAPIPDILVPPVHPPNVLAWIEATQRRHEATQRRHDIMLHYIHSQLD